MFFNIKFYSIITLFLLIHDIDCIRNFRQGRHRGGNLGDPSNTLHRLSIEPSEEKWFIQRLDHFDPTISDKSWQQVRLF